MLNIRLKYCSQLAFGRFIIAERRKSDGPYGRRNTKPIAIAAYPARKTCVPNNPSSAARNAYEPNLSSLRQFPLSCFRR